MAKDKPSAPATDLSPVLSAAIGEILDAAAVAGADDSEGDAPLVIAPQPRDCWVLWQAHGNPTYAVGQIVAFTRAEADDIVEHGQGRLASDAEVQAFLTLSESL